MFPAQFTRVANKEFGINRQATAAPPSASNPAEEALPIPFRLLRHILALCIGTATFLVGCMLWGQANPPQFIVQPGQPDAEMLAGNWETDDPFSSPPAQMGILLKLLANRRVPFNGHRVTGDGPQKFQQFEIGVYVRTGGENHLAWFDTSDAQHATWDGSRLTVTSKAGGPGTGDLGLDLTYDKEKGFWTGSYTRGSMTKQVRLTRPGASHKPQSNPFVGGWAESGRPGHFGYSPPIPNCIHIAQGSDGTLVAWGDRKGSSIDPRDGFDVEIIDETDGDAIGVKIDNDALTLQGGINWWGGNPPGRFTGKLSPDGTQITGIWIVHAPESWGMLGAPQQEKSSQPVRFSTFTKLPEGQSCWSQPPGLQAASGKQ